MESSHNPLPGQIWAVFFEDDVYWHERLLLWRAGENQWYVLTPDLDLYVEDWSLGGGEGPVKIKGLTSGIGPEWVEAATGLPSP